MSKTNKRIKGQMAEREENRQTERKKCIYQTKYGWTDDRQRGR